MIVFFVFKVGPFQNKLGIKIGFRCLILLTEGYI